MDLKTITYTEIWNKAPSAEPERQEYFMDLCRRAVEARCQGYLYAVAEEGGGFLDFIVRGESRL